MIVSYDLISASGYGDEQRQASKGKGLFNAVACLLAGYWERDLLRGCEWLEGENFTDELGACITGIDIRIGNAEYSCTISKGTDAKSLYFSDMIVFNVGVVTRTTSTKWHLKAMESATRIIPQNHRVTFKAWECLT